MFKVILFVAASKFNYNLTNKELFFLKNYNYTTNLRITGALLGIKKEADHAASLLLLVFQSDIRSHPAQALPLQPS